MSKLGLTLSTQGKAKVQTMLKRLLMKNHFIHQYLSQLAQADLRIANQIVFQKAGNHGYDKIRRALANEMFRNFPKAPLAALIWTLRNRKIPSEID